jgi:hypothetical protein
MGKVMCWQPTITSGLCCLIEAHMKRICELCYADLSRGRFLVYAEAGCLQSGILKSKATRPSRGASAKSMEKSPRSRGSMWVGNIDPADLGSTGRIGLLCIPAFSQVFSSHQIHASDRKNKRALHGNRINHTPPLCCLDHKREIDEDRLSPWYKKKKGGDDHLFQHEQSYRP